MTKKTEEKHPAVEVAHVINEKEKGDGTVELSTGYKAKLVPVSASLIDQVTSRIKDPDPPMWMNESKGREEPNPADPKYLRELEDAGRRRGLAAMDALIMFGVELEEPIPEDTTWIKKLKLLGIDVDTDDPFEIEFYFKKYIAVSAEDISMVTQRSGMSAEEVAEAERSFRGSAK